MGQLIIEVSTDAYSKPRLYRFDSLPVRIGRGYQNDLVLTDPFTCPEHLEITADDEGFLVEDLGSVNGVSVRGKRLKEKTCLPSGTTLRIGNSRLRLLASTHAVKETQTMSFWAKHQLIFRILAWLSLLPALGIMVLGEYFSTSTEVSFLELVDEVFVVLFLAPAWASIWAGIGHSATNRTRFHAQLFLGSAFLIVMTVSDKLSEYVAYATNCNVIETIGSHLVPVFVIVMLLMFSLKLATVMRRRVRIAISLAISLTLIILFSLSDIASRNSFNKYPTFPATLKPPCFQLTKSSELSGFLADSKQVFEDSREQAED